MGVIYLEMSELRDKILKDLDISEDLITNAIETKEQKCTDEQCTDCPPPQTLKRKIFDDLDIAETPKPVEKPKKKVVSTNQQSMPLNYRGFLSAAYKVFEEETLIKIESQQMKSHMGSMLDQCKAKQASQGDKLMLRLRHLLDYVPKSYKGWERSKMQKMFHRKFMQATCIHLYRNDADIDMDRIMKMNKFDNLKQQVLCLTPRRFGKSTSVAMFVASYVLTVPYSEQCIFSTGRRASQKLLELIRDMIKAGKEGWRFIKCNGETMLIQGFTSGRP